MIELIEMPEDGQFTVGARYTVEYFHNKIAWVLDDVGEYEPVYPHQYKEV